MDAGNVGGDRRLAVAFETHRGMLLQHARYFLGNRQADAEDFVQDTFERFMVAFPGGPPPEPGCGSWLMTVLTNLLISDWRRQDVQHRNQTDPALHLVTSPQPLEGIDSRPPPTILDTALEKLSHEAFRAAVQSLSPKLRVTYVLHVLQLGHAEIATRLNISHVAVRKRLHDARQHLLKRLQLGLDEEAS